MAYFQEKLFFNNYYNSFLFSISIFVYDKKKKDKNPLTVIIPFYNEENTLAKCIEKVLQTLEKYLHEVILIDDGSTDSSYEIAYNIKKNIKLK